MNKGILLVLITLVISISGNATGKWKMQSVEDIISQLAIDGNRINKNYEKIGKDKNTIFYLHKTKDKKEVNISVKSTNLCIELTVNCDKANVECVLKDIKTAHGLGDAGGWNRDFNLMSDNEAKFSIQNNGESQRWASTFAIFPKNKLATVFFSDGKKEVITQKNTYRMKSYGVNKSVYYFLSGDTHQIYQSYKEIRASNGFTDVNPKARLFELGWESWDALGWNTSQTTVKETLNNYLNNGYPIKWAVTGSGFWDTGETTTSFGIFGQKFNNPKEFRNLLNENDIYWMIGLRTNFIPSGGPYFPMTKKRDKNLKVNSFKGNQLSDVGLKNDFFIKSEDGTVLKKTSGVFPIVPCYILDGNNEKASYWFADLFRNWGVQGIKEDTMMDLKDNTNVFNKAITNIAQDGNLVMARCGYISSPGTLLRINDTGVYDMKKRTPINYLSYAASGCPNVYSDVVGIHNMHNVNGRSANIRHAWFTSLTAGMALGKNPEGWLPEEKKAFKKAVDFHVSLVPYLYSSGKKTYDTGFPYTMTPMEIAYPNTNEKIPNFQWMIGESVLATPILKQYEEGQMDIYLPEGIWYNFNTSEKFKGDRVLSKYKFSVNDVPCFVGGKGILILRQSDGNISARVYEVGKESKEQFYTLDNGQIYTIENKTKNLFNCVVKDTKTNKLISYDANKGYIEFKIKEGENYVIE